MEGRLDEFFGTERRDISRWLLARTEENENEDYSARGLSFRTVYRVLGGRKI